MRKSLFFIFFSIIIACEYSGKYLKTGDRYFQETNYAAAVKEYGKAEAINPHNATIFLHRGKALERLGLFDSAAIDFQKNLKYDDHNAEAMGHLAWCWYSTTPPKREACRKQMKEALEIDPSLPELWYLAGRMHFHSNDLPRAEFALKKAIKLEKNYTDAMGLLARVLERSQRLSQAIPLVAQVLKVDPKNAEATHVAAEVSRSKNQIELAQRQAQRAHFLDPSFPIPKEPDLQAFKIPQDSSAVAAIAEVAQPVNPNPNGKNVPKSEISLAPLADFLTTDSSIAYDLPSDTVFEQLLLRLIDSALTDSGILASSGLDSMQQQWALQSIFGDSLVVDSGIPNALPDTSNRIIQWINQHVQENPGNEMDDRLPITSVKDSTLSAFEKGVWIRYWVKNQNYSQIKKSLNNEAYASFFSTKKGSIQFILAVTHQRLNQTSLAKHYFRLACQEIPLSPSIFKKENISITR